MRLKNKNQSNHLPNSAFDMKEDKEGISEAIEILINAHTCVESTAMMYLCIDWI